jgi:DNA repair exonuclease SbcCD ATPase subunit
MSDIDVNQLRSDLARVQKRCSEWRGQAAGLQEQQHALRGELEQAQAQGIVLEKAQAVLQQLEDTWRGHYNTALGALGSQGLSAVFTAGKYEVLLESTIKRGVSNLDIVLVKDGKRVRLKGGSGGSVVQVLAYLLRHLITTSARPGLRHLEALDEPFSMVRAEQRPALGALVREITQRLDFQFLFSSDEDELVDVADVVYLIHPGGRAERVKSAQEERA